VFADRDSLPYIVATVRETLRWRTLSPVAVPHLLTEDDWYEGYYIPKGTICIANAWAMNRDPRIYGEDIDEFRPERFLDEAGALKPLHPDTQQEGHASYGFGRRICVGRHVSNNSMYIDIASMLWATWIENAPGAPMPDNVSMLDDGLVVYVPTFLLLGFDSHILIPFTAVLFPSLARSPLVSLKCPTSSLGPRS